MDKTLRAIYYVALCDGSFTNAIADSEADGIIVDALRTSGLFGMTRFWDMKTNATRTWPARTEITLTELIRKMGEANG